jgi:hypothetical protein
MRGLFLFWRWNRKLLTVKSTLLSPLFDESTGLLANSSFHLQDVDVAYGLCIFQSVIRLPFLSGPRFQRFNILGVAEFQTILNSWREIGAIATIGSTDWDRMTKQTVHIQQQTCRYVHSIRGPCLFHDRSNVGSTEQFFSLRTRSNCEPAVTDVHCLSLYTATDLSSE